jgi:rhodanese-related sulfurtransferase
MKAIGTQELKKMLDHEERLTLVNTLAEEHFTQTQIPGAINIPQDSDDFVQRVEQAAGGRDRPVVVYCASAQCDSSTQGAQKLEAAGFSEVYDYEEGAKAWQEAGQTKQATA